ncbi:lipopolysaccharide biosynthesis protein [Candidatus Pristimantibacillus sp. PTI5]|uniref:lipopolysaccharide biosynthesis protein n=1 Tax=Candidatus Pristimantibacillus sp. PTI5 TaxID=3400422 RepID=UPI003B018512
MKRKILMLSKMPLVRNASILVTGTAAAQLVTFSLSPFITRIYGPGAFGVLAVFMAIVGIITPIAALTYPISIVLPKSNSEARGLVRLSLYITICITLLVSVILLVFNQFIVRFFQIEDIASFLYLIPIVILCSGFLQVVEQWLIRTKQFKITAKVTFLQNIIMQSSKIGIGFFYPVAGVLIIFTALGEGIKALMMFFLIRKTEDKHSNNIAEDQIPIKELSKKYKDFPLYRAPEVLIDAISSSLPLILLASYFGPNSAGYYSIGGAVLNIPSALIGKSIGDVLYPKISDTANNDENLTNLIKKATLVLGSMGIIPFGVLIVFGPWLFSLVFGAEWVTAGEYARWMALWIFCMFINLPSVKALPVLSAQSFHLKFTIASLLTRIVALTIGFYVFSDDSIAIALFGITGAILNISLILLTLKKSRNFDSLRMNN